MAFTEKPPILRGSPQEQIAAIRDYLFRMAQSLDTAASAESAAAAAYTVTPDGRRVYSKDTDKSLQEVRKSAGELRDLIIKSAKEVTVYVDKKTENFSELYVAKSEFGAFEENIQSTIETTARGVVESYDYTSQISSVQDDLNLMQDYFSAVNGEIRRGIVMDPDTGQYVTGIAISQSLQFSGECGPTDGNNPGDGYTYYYLETGQTFGLYTSSGWQFWIDGIKKGWFDSLDGRLHAANVVVENILQLGDSWQVSSSADGSEFSIMHIGG